MSNQFNQLPYVSTRSFTRPHTKPLSQVARCPICPVPDESSKLMACGGCHVVHYCGHDHQKKHRNAHKQACKKIVEKQAILNKLPRLLGLVLIGQGESQEQPNARSWLHIQIRSELAEALLAIDTSIAVRRAHDFLEDTLRLSMRDALGARYSIPGLKLRLGRTQECFDFCSHWIVEADKVR